MEPGTRPPMMLAPGAPAPSLRFPGADDRPPPDEHLVRPGTRDEMIRGRLVQAMPSAPPHADTQSTLNYVLQAHARPGYVVSTELLTRVGPRSDFATDVCIRKEGTDPSGRRHLEEVAFEVVNEQPTADVTAKAEDMTARGVRRVFSVFVKTGEVKEWRGAWQSIPLESTIADPLFARPLPVRAVLAGAARHLSEQARGTLSQAAADDAVVLALDAKGNEAIRGIEARGANRGRCAGLAEALLTLLAARGFTLPPELRTRVLGCEDPAMLTAWIAQGSAAPSLQDIFGP